MNLANKLQENVVDYCKGLSHEDLQNLVIYLGNEIEANVKPTKIQQEFCEMFLGAVNYAYFLKYWSLPEKERPIFSNTKTIRSDLNELYMYVSWQANLRVGRLLLEVSEWKVKASKLELKIADKKLETAKLKEDLANAVLDSYEGDIFYKDDGWCNISDVLVKHKLIKLE